MRILIIFLTLLGLCGCASSPKYAPMPSVRTDSVGSVIETNFSQLRSMLESLRHEVSTRDSVSTKDSKVIIINQQGDTVYREIVRERDTSHSRDEVVESLRHYYDSVMRSQDARLESIIKKLDSIPVPVEKELTWWEKTKQEAGGIAIGCVLAVIVAAVVWLIKKLKRN